MEAAASAAQPERRAKARLVYSGFAIPFVLLILCFAAWGAAANLTDVLVGVFRSIFDMSNVQAALVQFAYYGAYFTLAIPAAMINRRFGYKVGVLSGLGLASVGGLLFIPASEILVYGVFLDRPLRAGGRAVDPRDVGQPLRDRDGARGERDPAAQPRPGVQPRRREHRRAAGGRAHPSADHLGGGEDDHEPRRADAEPGGRPGAGARALPRDRLRADPDLAAHRVPQDVHAGGGEPGGGRARPAAGRSAACGATATTATGWPLSSSTSGRRSARGRSRSCTRRTSWGCRRRTPAGTCRPA